MSLYINSQKIETFKFGGGERNLNLAGFDCSYPLTIESFVKSSDDIMDLVLAVDAIRCMHKDAVIDLVLPYLPYARQDRVFKHGDPFSLKAFAKIINSLKFNKVVIYDQHSSVSSALIDNVKNVTSVEVIEQSPFRKELKRLKPILISPDIGGYKRMLDVRDAFSVPDYGYAIKQRNIDGSISNIELAMPYSKDRNILIIDDICDGGRTFVELSKYIKKEYDVKAIYLYVTNGIFSQGLSVLKPHLDMVFCNFCHLPVESIDGSYLKVYNTYV